MLNEATWGFVNATDPRLFLLLMSNNYLKRPPPGGLSFFLLKLMRHFMRQLDGI